MNANLALDTAQGRKTMSGAGLRTFFNIADLWKLSGKESMTLLGVANESTFYKWKRDPNCCTLARDTLERISYILGIYKALQILLPRESSADDWIKKENNAPMFGGRSALERMLSGNVVDLYVVRQYLDAQRGGM